MKIKAFVSVLFILMFSSGFAYAGKVTVNLGYAGAEGCVYSVLADEFEVLAEKYSNNTIDVKVRCCTQLATEDEAFKAMQLGTVDMYIITSNNISPHFPLMDAFVLPYIFQNKEHTYKILNGPIGKDFAEQLRKATGVYLLTYGFVGHRDFYNSVRPINSMADMKGIKIRVPKNQVMIETFRAFGAAPIPLAWAETPTALQTGTVQGADNGTSFIKSQKFYELADNLAILEHFSYFSPLFASPRVMKKFSAEQKQAILRAAEEAGNYHRDKMQKEVSEIREFLKTTGGMTTTYPDKAEFIKAALTVQDKYMADKGDDFKSLVKAIREAAK
ncbi:MAG: TRAP transporter substrate-binding protein [Deltaproteobacteria bacterium]|nr:TRAP transporter substrate-binding protein [Deltaproteobacteria bacterium]